MHLHSDRDWLIIGSRPTRPRIADVARITYDAFGADIAFMRTERRGRAFVEPRHAAIYLAHKYCLATTPTIGRFFERDHSSVAYALRTMPQRRAREGHIAEAMDAAEAEIISKWGPANG